MNITIFYGPHNSFEEIIPKEDFVTLSEFVYKHDEKIRTHRVFTDENNNIEIEKERFQAVIAYSEDYSSLNEHAIQSFIPLLMSADINNIFLQNPPYIIFSQLNKKFGNAVKIKKHKYSTIKMDFLKKINSEFDSSIIGQRNVKIKLLSSLYSLVNRNSKKKVKVMLFYGPSGVGKTETAKFLSNILGEKLFREQMSMYQNSEFQSYLFGGKHSQDSFAKRLSNRKSNIILLDEFDKCNPLFHSAFYQLFDEGIFKDKNYRIELNNSIIICTSNYLNTQDIKMNLGDPIYSRFDSIVEFSELAKNDKEIILKNEFNRQLDIISKTDRKIIDEELLWSIIEKHLEKMSNIRQMKSFIVDLINTTIVQKKLI